jgi:hypothetical protein
MLDEVPEDASVNAADPAAEVDPDSRHDPPSLGNRLGPVNAHCLLVAAQFKSAHGACHVESPDGAGAILPDPRLLRVAEANAHDLVARSKRASRPMT